jgi:hypothetical protein
VEISGVGRSTSSDPWERDEPNGPLNKGEAKLFASQTAVFTRVLHTAEMHRHQYEGHAIDLIQEALAREERQHDMLPLLFANHTLQCHPNLTSNQPTLSHEAILQEVRKVITESCTRSAPGEAEVWDIWNVDAVSLACGGRLDQLYEALEHAGIGNDIGSVLGSEASGLSPLSDEWKWIEPEKRTRWTRRVKWNHYIAPRDDGPSWKSERVNDTPLLKTQASAWENTVHEPWDDTRGWGETTTGFLSTADGTKDEKGFDGWGPLGG